MNSLLSFLCRIHIIVKYMLNHKKTEIFFPILTCSFWLSIIVQSSYNLISSRLVEFDDNYQLSSNTIDIIIASIFFLTIIGFYKAVGNKKRYECEEIWFMSKTTQQRSLLLLSAGILMLISFVGLLSWSIYEM